MPSLTNKLTRWVTGETASEIARAEVERRGYTWEGKQIRVTPGFAKATVLVGANLRGGQIRVRIKRRTGSVDSFWIAPK